MNKQTKVIYIYLFFIIIIFGLFNVAVPFHSDDLSWVMDYKGIDCSLFLEKVFACQVHHYFTQNGRLVCHFLLQILVAGGETFFNVSNTFIFTFCVIFTYRYSMGTIRKLYWLPLFLIILSFFYLCPNSESLFYWAAGSLNYLLPTLLTVCVFLLKDYITRFKDVKLLRLLAISCFSFFAGWTHEMYVLPIASAMVLNVIYRNKRFDKRLLFLYIPYCIGALFIVISPGTLHRIGAEGSGGSVTSLPSLTVLINKFLESFKILRDGRMLYILLFGGLYMLCSKRQLLRTYVASNRFILVVLMFSIAMMGLLGVGGRAIWGIEYLSLVIIVRFFQQMTSVFYERNVVGKVLSFLILMHLALLVKPYFLSWDTYRDAFRQSKTKDFNGTVVIENWHSDNLLIDNFVAHIYDNFQTDMWQRIPLRAEIITPEVYDGIKKNQNDSTWLEPRSIRDTWVVPNDALDGKRKSVYVFKPIQFNTQYNSCLANMWHMFLQKIYSNRYPVRAVVDEQNMAHITVNNKQYVFYRMPMLPVWREIDRVELEQ